MLVLSTKGEVPGDLRNRIQKETDTDVLNEWIRLAAAAKDAEEFRGKIERNI